MYEQWATYLWCVVGALAMGDLFVSGLWRLPSEWDALSYHLPILDHWLQAQSLYAPDCRQWTTPANNELMSLWAVAPFSGDFLACLGSVFPTIVLGTSTVGVCLHLGLPGMASHLGGLAVTTNLIVFRQLANLDTDVAVAASFMASIHYALRYLEGYRELT